MNELIFRLRNWWWRLNRLDEDVRCADCPIVCNPDCAYADDEGNRICERCWEASQRVKAEDIEQQMYERSPAGIVAEFADRNFADRNFNE